MEKALVAYATMSGNTAEVADIIRDELGNAGISSIGYDVNGVDKPPTDFDALFIGTYTWDHGTTPDEVKDFAADLGYKPGTVYVFGTGDTQFGGDELFCKAADKLARFYNSPVDPLKIEQSPRGSQEKKVRDWAQYIVERKC